MAAKRFAGANTRNVCILAHVDHGKSSYADSLLAANNIISPRMAGQLRYLDSREDEQERGITMESSAVSLAYKVLRKDEADGKDVVEDYRINLIDTPGHVDFSSEVSTASRLCDGALVLVDAVEGVCTQTITVLRQAWTERLRPILVINKIDRLIVELKLSPSEAYHHLSQLIEQVNAVMGSFFASERMEDDLRWREERDRRLQAKKDKMAETLADEANAEEQTAAEEAFEERDDEDIYFDPAKGDVLFASALDGWAFRTSRFAQLWAKKLSIRETNLRRCLWGDFYLDPKTKRVLSKKHLGPKRNLKPMFVQFVLDNIWAAYDAISINPDPTKTEKIIKALELKIRPQDLRAKDTRVLLTSVFSQWLPLASATFRAIVEKVPSPSVAQSIRIPKMLHPDLASSQTSVAPRSPLERDLYSGLPGPQAATVAYASKIFAVPWSELPQNRRKVLTAEEMRERGREARARMEAQKELEDSTGAVVLSPEEAVARAAAATTEPNGVAKENGSGEGSKAEDSAPQEALLGFARLYSGTISIGQSFSVVLPKYTTTLPPTHSRNAKHLFRDVKIEQLYLIMGRELVSVDEVPAGNVFGIGGLEGKVLRNATLCAPPEGVVEGDANEWLVNLAGLNLVPAPIVRVSLEPRQPADMPKLVEGLRLLNQADPCVETLVQETGEHVILTAGELHLERCLRDLRERFAKIKIQASKPIVPFRETAVRGVDMPPPKVKEAPRGTARGSVHDGLVSFTVRAQPLPPNVTSFLLHHSESVRRIQAQDRRGAAAEADALETGAAQDGGAEVGQKVLDAERFWKEIAEEFVKAGRDWKDAEGLVWTFGPRRVGPNVLLDRTGDSSRSLKRRRLLKGGSAMVSGTATPSEAAPAPLSDASAHLQVPDPASAQATDSSSTIDLHEVDDSFETAFQLATLRGPLCAEPVAGMAFSLDKLEVDPDVASLETVRAKWSQVTGALISSLREAFHAAMLDWSPRLLLAMYSCDIQAATEVLGKVYGVVSRRRGTIVSEEMKEGTTFYTIRALLPVVESFGFADEIRKKTSGAASPQLVFAGYETLDQNPFWVPTTEEELEDLGEKSDRENVARKYMDAVRKRKGMFVDRKIIEHAEKQRTMKR